MFMLRGRAVDADLFKRFRDWSFNAANASGRLGPSASQLSGFYSSVVNPLVTDARFFSSQGGTQRWKVPSSGVYTVVAAGAAGGDATSTNSAQPVRPGGPGAVVEADVFLSRGQEVSIVVGQRGSGTPFSSSATERAGGGGGSFVWFSATSQPIVVAGGGGAASGDPGTGQAGRAASTGTSGTPSVSGNGQGGTNGQGGVSAGGSFRAGAGGGFLTAGSGGGDGKDGASALAGAAGGDCAPSSGHPMNGGFGGGGADARLNSTSRDSEGTGGGGGYSGGAGGNASSDDAGGGGGSFISAAALRAATSDGSFVRTGSEPHAAFSGPVGNLGAFNVADGYVVITDMPLIYSDPFTSNTSSNYVQSSFNGGSFAWSWNTGAGELNSGTSNRRMAIRLSPAAMGGVKSEVRVESHYLGTSDNDGSGLWLRTSGGANYLAVITDDFPSGARGISLWPSLDSGDFQLLAAGVDFPVKSPHFFSLVYRNGMLRFEVDGLLCAQVEVGQLAVESVGMLSLAQNPTARYGNFIVRGR